MGSVTARPPSGPDAPISTSALRLGMGSRREMNAPMVPNGGMKGMKYGRDASTPFFLDA